MNHATEDHVKAYQRIVRERRTGGRRRAERPARPHPSAPSTVALRLGAPRARTA